MIKTIKELERIVKVVKENYQQLCKMDVKVVLDGALSIYVFERNKEDEDNIHIMYDKNIKACIYKYDKMDFSMLDENRLKLLKSTLISLTNEVLESIIREQINRATEKCIREQIICTNFLCDVRKAVKGVDMEVIIPFMSQGRKGKMIISKSEVVCILGNGTYAFSVDENAFYSDRCRSFVARHGESILKALSTTF